MPLGTRGDARDVDKAISRDPVRRAQTRVVSQRDRRLRLRNNRANHIRPGAGSERVGCSDTEPVWRSIAEILHGQRRHRRWLQNGGLREEVVDTLLHLVRDDRQVWQNRERRIPPEVNRLVVVPPREEGRDGRQRRHRRGPGGRVGNVEQTNLKLRRTGRGVVGPKWIACPIGDRCGGHDLVDPRLENTGRREGHAVAGLSEPEDVVLPGNEQRAVACERERRGHDGGRIDACTAINDLERERCTVPCRRALELHLVEIDVDIGGTIVPRVDDHEIRRAL